MPRSWCTVYGWICPLPLSARPCSCCIRGSIQIFVVSRRSAKTTVPSALSRHVHCARRLRRCFCFLHVFLFLCCCCCCWSRCCPCGTGGQLSDHAVAEPRAEARGSWMAPLTSPPRFESPLCCVQESVRVKVRAALTKQMKAELANTLEASQTAAAQRTCRQQAVAADTCTHRRQSSLARI